MLYRARLKVVPAAYTAVRPCRATTADKGGLAQLLLDSRFTLESDLAHAATLQDHPAGKRGLASKSSVAMASCVSPPHANLHSTTLWSYPVNGITSARPIPGDMRIRGRAILHNCHVALLQICQRPGGPTCSCAICLDQQVCTCKPMKKS